MFLRTLWVAAAAAVVVVDSGLPLPPYIKACGRHDPNLNECARRNGNAALPTLVKGDPKYRLPVLDPLLVERFMVDQGSGPVSIKLEGTDMLLYGLKDTSIEALNIDLDGNKMSAQVTIPHIFIRSKYRLVGQVLVLPIRGNGYFNMTIDGFSCTTNHILQRVEEKGQVYLRFLPPKIKYDVKKATMYFENLFNGDKRLGDTMNSFLNQNWRELYKEIGPAVGEVIRTVLQTILSAAMEGVALDDLLPEGA
ncbi:protein takeout-like [Bacillus rossius redtenbacheri]|uniref:protein takeout-like n=1 Tax=Bacillus rossius redtenbacheri TaxID=93214 RepID=UPI002FDD5725